MASLSMLLLTFFFLIFTTPSSTESSQFPSLLSLSCTPPNRTIPNVNLSETLTFQCQHNLPPNLCNLCARIANQTLQHLCPNPTSATAWFDACYLVVKSPQSKSNKFINCSNRITMAQDRAGFEQNLEALLLRLRADIYNGISTGYIQRETGSSIYGIIKCGKLLSDEECLVCAGEGIDKLYECCGGREGGAVATENCVVRYETYRFYTELRSTDNGDSGGDVVYYEKEDLNRESNWKVKAELIWGLCCMLLIVLCAFVLKKLVFVDNESNKVHDITGDEGIV